MTVNNHTKSPRSVIGPLVIAGIGILALTFYVKTNTSPEPDRMDASAGAGAPRNNEDDAARSNELFEELARLEALGYLRGSKRLSPSISGITIFEADAVEAGLNLCTSAHDTSAFLADMEGRVLHTWRNGLEDGWPGDESGLPWRPAQHWRRVHLLPGGDLLVVFEGARAS